MTPACAASVKERRKALLTNAAFVADRLSTAVKEHLAMRLRRMARSLSFSTRELFPQPLGPCTANVRVGVAPSRTWAMKARTS